MDESTEVLVAGGGLVGLSAAMFLARDGVPAVLAERHAGSSAHPRAIGYTTRTLELFRTVGLTFPSSHQGKPRRARVESLAGRWHEEYPWSPDGAAKPGIEYSPCTGTAIAQDRLEPVLRDKATELGADIRMNTELTGFTQDDGGVTATLRHRDGHDYQLRAQYLVAADGVHSQVRESLGIGRSGQGRLAHQRSILFRAPLEEYLERGVVQFEIEQPGLSAFLTTYSDGRWVLMLADDIERDEDEQRRLVRQATGLPDLDVELLTTGRWELAALIADRFRDGRVFLAGDAAHQLPPNRGGYGANTGIDDANNLAWKLAAVTSGQSTPALLESYDAERRPVAWLRHEQIFARADYKARLTTAVADVPVIDDDAMELGQLYRSAAVLGAGPELPRALRPDQWAGQPGTRAPHVPVLAGGTESSTLDLFQHGWVLLSEDGNWAAAAAHAAVGTGIAVTFVHVGTDTKPAEPAAFQTAYGLQPGGATLARPDGYVAWRSVTAPADPAGTLTAALAKRVRRGRAGPGAWTSRIMMPVMTDRSTFGLLAGRITPGGSREPAGETVMRLRSSSGRSTAKGRSREASSEGSQSSRSACSSTRNQRPVCGSAPPAGGSSFTIAMLGEPGADLLDGALDAQGHFVPVRGLGESGQDVLRRVESGGWLERAGQRPGVRDAIEPERPVLADAGIRTGHIPAAGVDDEPVGVQGAFAAPAVGGGVPDRDRPVMAHGVDAEPPGKLGHRPDAGRLQELLFAGADTAACA